MPRLRTALGAVALLTTVTALTGAGSAWSHRGARFSAETSVTTEDPAVVSIAPNTASSHLFVVQNIGDASGTAYFSCVAPQRATCTGVSPTSALLEPNQSVEVWAYFTSGSPGVGFVQLHSSLGSFGTLKLLISTL